MPDSQGQNRRRDFRVDDVLPMKDTPLNEEEFERERTHIGIRSRQSSMLRTIVGDDVFASAAPEADTELCNAIRSLDAKLNYLIGVNMLNDANRSDLEERPVNLSVSGMSFVTPRAYKEGDGLEVVLMLPALPPLVLEVLGRVRRVESRPKGQHLVGVSFVFRCQDEEDQISRYVFKRHREVIRMEALQQEQARQRMA